jgi:hypothetical protein
MDRRKGRVALPGPWVCDGPFENLARPLEGA